jgi:hypothetical protein
MATITGTRYSFSDTANVAIDMSDTLYMISPFDVPLLRKVGENSLASPCVSTKHEWLETALRGLDTAIATQGEFSGTGAVTTSTVTAGQGVFLRAGDILLIESELCLLASISTDTLNIAAGGRGYGGSTAASHASLVAIKVVGNVNVQDAAVGASRTTTKAGLFNYTQLMEDAVVVTTTEAAIKKYVETNTMTAQLRDAMRVAWILWERTLLHGRKVAPSAGVASAMDGILVRISTNAYAKAGAALTEDHLRTALRDVWTAGGNPTDVWCNAFQKERISSFIDQMRETTRTDRTAGSVVSQYESEYGNVQINLDRNMPADTVLITETERIGFGPLNGNGVSHALRAVPIPQTTATKDTMQILGQYTSETRNETAHAKITGLATS